MYKRLLIDWSSVRSLPPEFIKTTPYRFSRGVVLGIFNSGTPWEPIISINTTFVATHLSLIVWNWHYMFHQNVTLNSKYLPHQRCHFRRL